MNEKNFDYLKDQVKFTGFGDKLENDLREKMEKRLPEFQLRYSTEFGYDTASATLHFKKSGQSDMCFFNKYDLSVKMESQPDEIKQTFYINKGSNITFKEAFNLMSGRAVNKDLTTKEGQAYNAWLQMDFKQTTPNGNFEVRQIHQNYGYNLEKELAKHPIKELANEQDKVKLLQSLERGNRQAVTFVKDGNEHRVFIEANPRFKTVNLYDSNMQRLNNRQNKTETQEQGRNKAAKQETGKENKTQPNTEGFPEPPKAVKKKRKNQSQSL